MRRLFSLLLLALACTSCVTMTLATVAATTAYALSAGQTRLKGQTVEKVTDKAALMRTNDGIVVLIVYPFEGYHDGMKVNAKFRRGGDYEYRDESGTLRHAPIYVESKHLGDLVETALSLDVRYRQREESPVYQV